MKQKTFATHFSPSRCANQRYPVCLHPMVQDSPRENNPLEAAGNVRLMYETPARGSQAAFMYDVIHLSGIVCRHHVVPDFANEHAFYVSAFSPSRPV